MVKINKFHTLEEGILILQKEMQSKPLSIAGILRILSGKGRPLILILLSLPFCQPIQIPGFSTPFGCAIAFIGLRMSFGKGFWLPQKLLSKTISVDVMEKITHKTLVLIRKMKLWLHPRLNWICHAPLMEKMHGLVIFSLGLILALPLPIPLSNLVAAWSIFLIALGILEDDGVVVLLGYLMFLLTIAFFVIMALTAKKIITS